MSTSMSGTQSPPVENTGSAEPMGKTDRKGGVSEGVKDSEQRKGYFQGSGSSENQQPQQSASGFIDKAIEVAKRSVARFDAQQKIRESGMMRY